RNQQEQAGSRALVSRQKTKRKKAAQRDDALNQALARLSRLVQNSRGLSNKLKEKLARQINELAKRWED
ncbi:MAG TPA: hypothetical protein PKZ39_02350, partial [Clostridia bacterium]|nr:hypothetical protein [Clostridia bacterium]